MKTTTVTALVLPVEVTDKSAKIVLRRCGSCLDWISDNVADSCPDDCGEENLCPKCVDDHGCGGN